MLSEAEQITYLANIIFAAGGSLNERQQAVFAQIQDKIGAKKTSLTKAMARAKSSNFSATPTGLLGDQVSNLGDMLYVAILDGDLSLNEKEIVLTFAKTVGLNDEQLKLVTTEALQRLKEDSAQRNCPECSAGVGSANFCPQCGASLADTPKSNGIAIPSSGYAIEFCESTSASFPEALKCAQDATTFSSETRGKKVWYLAAWSETNAQNALRLANLLSGLKNRRAYFNGVEVPWNELFGFAWCAEQRQHAYRPALYCFGADDRMLNPWGCKNIRMDWTEWADWFSYGRFERSLGVFKSSKVRWVFDKERIQHELSARLHDLRFCPHVRPTLITAIIDALPDTIDVTDSTEWKYKENYQETPGSIKVVEKEGSDEFAYTREYFADGVKPNGLLALQKILREAFAKASVDDIRIEDILRH